MLLVYVALGSAVGGLCRYLLGAAVQRYAGGDFPSGTLVINLTGSFLLGVILRYSAESTAVTPELRALLAVGLCGGYTTFSSFSYETLALLQEGDWRRAGVYVAASLAGALLAAAAGFALVREVFALRARS
jgi:fluoride exporter